MLANGLAFVKQSEISDHIRDIVKLTSRAQDSVQTANKLGSDKKFSNPKKAYNCHSPIPESDPSTSLFNSTRAHVGRLDMINLAMEDSQITGTVILNCWM